jgi:hypothetical protein
MTPPIQETLLTTPTEKYPFFHGEIDPWTGDNLGICFPGWQPYVADLKRWKARHPPFIQNAIKAREEMLQGTAIDEEQRRFYSFQLELIVQVAAGIL